MWASSALIQIESLQNFLPFFCNALIMITGVTETFAICHLYRFPWP